jgi:CheY-like chemotaxis protein
VSRDCILVVDDDDLVRDTMVELLQSHGCGAKGVANGFEAMEALLTSDAVCLIFLDLVMPVMDGAAFREEQLKHEKVKHIPVVLMSAYPHLPSRAKQISVDVYLQKPLAEAQIVDVMKRFCQCNRASA